jgi:hypothetical protein
LARAIDRLGRSTLRESPKAGEAERNDESFAHSKLLIRLRCRCLAVSAGNVTCAPALNRS